MTTRGDPRASVEARIGTLVARAPTRIDFGGGWTDVPPYPEEEGGCVCNVAITRYATALDTGAIGDWTAGQPLSAAQLQQGLSTSAGDRTIVTTYDQRNQKIQVQQPAVSYVLSPFWGWTKGLFRRKPS